MIVDYFLFKLAVKLDKREKRKKKCFATFYMLGLPAKTMTETTSSLLPID